MTRLCGVVFGVYVVRPNSQATGAGSELRRSIRYNEMLPQTQTTSVIQVCLGGGF